MKKSYLSLILLLVCSLILVGCNKKKITPYFNQDTNEYTLTSDYTIQDNDITNFKKDIKIDLGGNTFDLNGKSFTVNTTSSSVVTFTNGTIKNGEINILTSKGAIKFNNVTIDKSVSKVTLSGQVELTNVTCNDINVESGSLSLKSVKTGESYSYDELTKVNNIYASTDALYESISIDAHSVAGNIYTENSAKVTVYGTVANIVLKGEGSFINAYDYSNIYAVYVNGKDSLIEYSENANVESTYINDDIVNSLIKYSNVESKSLETLSIPRFEIHNVKNLCSEAYPVVKYSYTALEGQKFIELETVKSHTYSEETLITKNYLLGNLVEYTCTECHSHIRELSKADRSLRDCDNFLDVLLLYVPNFNIDYSVDKEMAFNYGEYDVTINNAYVHVVSNEGSLGGVVTFDGTYNGLEKQYKLYVNNSTLYLLNKDEKAQGDVQELAEKTYTTKAQEIDLYELALDFVSKQANMEKESLEETLNEYFSYLQMGVDLFDITLTNVDDVYNLAYDFITKVLGIVFTEELMEYVQIENIIFTEEDGLYTLDLENILTYCNKTLEDAINEIYGEGSCDELIDFLSDKLPNMTVSELTDYVITYAKANNIDSDKIFKAINAVMNVKNHTTDFDIYKLINDEQPDLCLNSETGKSIKEIKEILDFVAKDNLDEIKKTTLYEVYELYSEFTETDVIPYEEIRQMVIQYKEYVDFSYKMDENENVTYMYFAYFDAYEKQGEVTDVKNIISKDIIKEYVRPALPTVTFTYNEEELISFSLELLNNTTKALEKIIDLTGTEDEIKSAKINSYNRLDGYSVVIDYDGTDDSHQFGEYTFETTGSTKFIVKGLYDRTFVDNNETINASVTYNNAYDTEKKAYDTTKENKLFVYSLVQGLDTIYSDLLGNGEITVTRKDDNYTLDLDVPKKVLISASISDTTYELEVSASMYEDKSVEIKESEEYPLLPIYYGYFKYVENESVLFNLLIKHESTHKMHYDVNIERTISENIVSDSVSIKCDEDKLYTIEYSKVVDEDGTVTKSSSFNANKFNGDFTKKFVFNLGYQNSKFKDETLKSSMFNVNYRELAQDENDKTLYKEQDYSILDFDFTSTIEKSNAENYLLEYLYGLNIDCYYGTLIINQEDITDGNGDIRVHSTIDADIDSVGFTDINREQCYELLTFDYDDAYELINGSYKYVFNASFDFLYNRGMTSSKDRYSGSLSFIKDNELDKRVIKANYNQYHLTDSIAYIYAKNDLQENVDISTIIAVESNYGINDAKYNLLGSLYYYTISYNNEHNVTISDTSLDFSRIEYSYNSNTEQRLIKIANEVKQYYTDPTKTNILVDTNSSLNVVAKCNIGTTLDRTNDSYFTYPNYSKITNEPYSYKYTVSLKYELDRTYLIKSLTGNYTVCDYVYSFGSEDDKNRAECLVQSFADISLENGEDGLNIVGNLYDIDDNYNSGSYSLIKVKENNYIYTYLGKSFGELRQVKLSLDYNTFDYSIKYNNAKVQIKKDDYDNDNPQSINNCLDLSKVELLSDLLTAFEVYGNDRSLYFTDYCLDSKYSSTNYDKNIRNSFDMCGLQLIFSEVEKIKQEGLASITWFIKLDESNDTKTLKFHFEQNTDPMYDPSIKQEDRYIEFIEVCIEIKETASSTGSSYDYDIYYLSNIDLNSGISSKNMVYRSEILSGNYTDLYSLFNISVQDGFNELFDVLGDSGLNFLNAYYTFENDTYRFFIANNQSKHFDTINLFNLTVKNKELVLNIPGNRSSSNRVSSFDFNGLTFSLKEDIDDKTLKLTVNSYGTLTLVKDDNKTYNVQVDLADMYMGEIGLSFNSNNNRSLESFEDVFNMSKEEFDTYKETLVK